MVFVLFAFLPLVGMAAYSLVRRTPWYESYQNQLWQQRISDNLGVSVRFSSIEFPSPEHFRAHDLVCVHPETNREILKIKRVDAAMDQTGWTVDLVTPTLNGPEIQSAMQVVHDWFLCRPQKSASLLKLSVPEISVFDGVSNTLFKNVEVGVKPTESISTLLVKFSIEGQQFSNPKPAYLKVEREHMLESPRTNWEVVSDDIAIPCRVLGKRFPALSSLGQNASFRGTMRQTQDDLHWNAKISGVFDSVDLGMLTSPIGAPVRGLANLKVGCALLCDGRLDLARGSFEAIRSGSVETDWVRHTRQLFGLPWESSLDLVSSKNIPMDAIGVGFEFDSRGLLLSGLMKLQNAEQPEIEIALLLDGKAVKGSGNIHPLTTVLDWLKSPSGTGNQEMARFLSRTLPMQSPRVASDRR